MKRKTKPAPTRQKQIKPVEIPAEFLKPLPRPNDAGIKEAEGRLGAITAWWNFMHVSDAQSKRLGDLTHDLEDFIARTPARTPSGVMAKLRRLRYYTGVDEAMEGDIYSRDLLATALEAVGDFHLDASVEEDRLERRRMDAGIFRCPGEPHLDELAQKWLKHETAKPPAGLSDEERDDYIAQEADAASAVAMEIAQPGSTLEAVRLKLQIADAIDPPDERFPAGMLIMSALGDLMRLIARQRPAD